MKIAHAVFVVSLAAALGCNKSSENQPGPVAAADESAPVTASNAEAAAPAAAQAPSGSPASWSGSYKSERGSIYVPDGGEWSGVKWRGDDSKEGLGEGKLSLKLDPKTNTVEGTLEGPLGPAIVYGSVTGERLTATIARKDIADRGFVGTLDGKVAGASIEGTMKLSLADARVIREAHFQLQKGS